MSAMIRGKRAAAARGEGRYTVWAGGHFYPARRKTRSEIKYSAIDEVDLFSNWMGEKKTVKS